MPGAESVSGAQGMACFLCRLLTLPLVYFLSPIPPPPFPAGRGRSKVYFAGGFAPGTPALDRLRHLQALPGTRRLNPGGTTRGEPLSFGYAANHRLSPRGCKGRSPLHENNLNLPLPAGKGGGGMGAAKQAKGKVGRRPTGQATLWAPPTPAAPATCQANLPPGTTVAGIASAAGARHPIGHHSKRAPRAALACRAGRLGQRSPGSCRITCSAFSLPA